MNKFFALSACAALVVCATSGCKKVAEMSEEQIAEAIINQSISGYHEASISITVNEASIAMQCTSGGTVAWGEAELNETESTWCYTADSKSCTMSTRLGEMTLSGSSTTCGYPYAVEDADGDGVYSLDGGDLSIKGSVQASTDSRTSQTCDYELVLSKISVTGEGDSITVSSQATGTMCGKRDFSMSSSVTVSGSVAVTP